MAPKVYLAGPITGLSYGSCNDWREFARNEFSKSGIIGISPMRAKEFLKDEGILADSYDSVMCTESGITTRDRFDVYSCDILLANFLGAEKISAGTMIEYGWADAFRKPIVTIMEKSGNPNDHSMVRRLTGFRVETLESGLAVVKSILTY